VDVAGSSRSEVGAARTLVGAIVGIDGCGKTSTFRDAVDRLAASVVTVGVGEVAIAGRPGQTPVERTDIPLSRSARLVGAIAKRLRHPRLYKDLKLIEFIERTHVRNHVIANDAPAVVVTDGDALVNVAAWAVARYSRSELVGDDERLVDVLHYLAGDRRIPMRQVPWYLRHGWQLAVLNRLHLASFGSPDIVFLLEIDPPVAMERIAARGGPLQGHENIGFLGELAAGYERVCTVLEDRCRVPVVRIRVTDMSHEETVRVVAETMIAHRAASLAVSGPFLADAIEVVATTMSGSFADQRKVGHIADAFRSATGRTARLHPAHTHPDARRIAHAIVAGGGRTVVSAGGAGTFNAVLEGCHVDDVVPPDLRLAFLRKGSADLIGKVLHVADDLELAVAGIAEGIDADRRLGADVLAVDVIGPDGATVRRHLVGFGGLGVFGDVPRFTETRIIKYYKGLLGTLFGDLGPFFTGLVLASIYWWMRRLVGRIPPLALTLDDEAFPAERWVAVIVMNGDLGKDFPLGAGLPLESGTFRVLVLRYAGVRMMLRQIVACRTAALLDDPTGYGAIVREVRTLSARPTRMHRPYMVNVDGLRQMAAGDVRVTVTGHVWLVDTLPRAAPPPAVVEGRARSRLSRRAAGGRWPRPGCRGAARRGRGSRLGRAPGSSDRRHR